jgi:hypothetical protein
MPVLEERVSSLEDVMEQLARSQVKTELSVQRLSDELRECQAKTELSVQRLSDEMREFKDKTDKAMAQSAREMSEFRERTDKAMAQGELRMSEMNRQWGALANKLGTIVEDIAAPNIRRLAVEEFGMRSISDFYVRATRRSRSGRVRQAEFDVICAGDDTVIFGEMKSTATIESIEKFQNQVAEFWDFFPEYVGLKLIAIYASWSLDEKLCSEISKRGMYGMAMGPMTMEIVVRPGLAE